MNNKIALFPELNQGDVSNQWYLCSLFAPAIAIKYNFWIVITEDEIDKIAKEQSRKWLLSYTTWGSALQWILAILSYVNTKYKRKFTFESIKNNDYIKINQILETWYALTLWIKVNHVFINDTKDWKIDETNYFKFTTWKTYWHFLNLVKWKDRFSWSKWPDYNKLMIIDNYAFNKKDRQWIYYDLKLENLKVFSQNYYYLIKE